MSDGLVPASAISARLVTPGSRISSWRKTVLWTVGAYLILNTGFETIRFPPIGPGIPVGEIILLISFCIMSSTVLLPKMAVETWLFPVLLRWGMALSRAVIDVKIGGVWSFRDASQAIESLYLVIGFWLVNTPDNLEYFFAWLRKIMVAIILYGLLFPFSKTLQTVSPSLPGVSSSSRTILFWMTNTPSLLLWAVCLFLFVFFVFFLFF